MLYGEAFSHVYDSYFKPATEFMMLRYLPIIKQIVKDNDTILNLCCGTGRFESELSKLKIKVIGLDISDEMLELAKKNCIKENVTFIQGNVINFKLEKKVKVVTAMTDGLAHLISKELILSAFKNSYECLEDEGYLIFDLQTRSGIRINWSEQSTTENDKMFLAECGIILKDVAYRRCAGVVKIDDVYERFEQIFHNNIYSISEVENYLTEAGFLSIIYDINNMQRLEDPESGTRLMFVCYKNKKQEMSTGHK